jgi:adenylate kinase family enzyme
MTYGRTDPSRSYLVEVVGTAGAGKSTLTRSIHRSEPEWRIAEFIHTRSPRDLRRVVHSVPGLFPIMIHGLGGQPRLSWREFKLLVYVSEWQRALDREPRRGVTLLDQGPIYALVRLKALAGRVSTSAAFARWWDRMLEAWAARLDAIVYLDADDAVLWSRINDRTQPHQTKGEAAWLGQRFITRYRRLFEEVLGRIDRPGGPEIMRFDTGEVGAERLAVETREIVAARSASLAVQGRAPDG